MRRVKGNSRRRLSSKLRILYLSMNLVMYNKSLISNPDMPPTNTFFDSKDSMALYNEFTTDSGRSLQSGTVLGIIRHSAHSELYGT